MSLNVLKEPIFSVNTAAGPACLSLPALYSAAIADEVEDLPAVRPHQRQALHAFLVQLGASALLKAKQINPPVTPTDWERLLRGLTPEYPGDEPWNLTVADLSKPALLQPPVPERSLAVLKECKETPDALDMLITSKNHDFKAKRMANARPEHWFYALLSLQTLEGFSGAGNYGISRMNGGFGSRPMIGIAPSGAMGARVRRDLCRLLGQREAILRDNPGFASRDGLALVWLKAWDGASQIKFRQLDPFYIEVCRRIRLIGLDSRLIARRTTTVVARIRSKNNGVTGDPWTPIGQHGDVPKALTIDGSGFHYRRVAGLLDPRQYRAAPLQLWNPDDGTDGLNLVLVATARGQGGTDGFHERRIPIPSGLIPFMHVHNNELATVARRHVNDAAEVRRQILRNALFALVQNGPRRVNHENVSSKTKAEPFLRAFDRCVDRIFFQATFKELEAGDDLSKEAARREMLFELKNFARAQLEAAKRILPRSGIRTYGAQVVADAVLEFAFRKRFPQCGGTSCLPPPATSSVGSSQCGQVSNRELRNSILLLGEKALDAMAGNFRKLVAAKARTDLVALKRLDPDHPEEELAFFKILSDCVPDSLFRHEIMSVDIPGFRPDLMQRFAAVASIMALRPDGLTSGGLGKIMANLGVTRQRLSSFLAARGALLHSLARRMAHRIARDVAALPYREFGLLLLLDGIVDCEVEHVRLDLAREFHSEIRKGQPSGTPEDGGEQL